MPLKLPGAYVYTCPTLLRTYCWKVGLSAPNLESADESYEAY